MTRLSSPAGSGLSHPGGVAVAEPFPSPADDSIIATSANTTPGNAGGGEYASTLSRPNSADDGGGEMSGHLVPPRSGGGGGRDGGRGEGGTPLSRTASSFSPQGESSTTGESGGLKRARDRRADRRKKKDPFEALEERLLDGFSLESITRQLERQDETLQKGVRRTLKRFVSLGLRIS